MYKVGAEQKRTGKRKRPPVLGPALLEEISDRYVRNDPNQDGTRKLRQLEVLERLHRLYQEAEIKRTILSYYLLVTETERMLLLSWMGSDLAKDIPKPLPDDLPNIPLRLAKIPADYALCGDKGFTGIEHYLPNVNEVVTPATVANSKTHRLSSEQIVSEIPVTSIRAPCETFFWRVVQEEALSEKIPYYLLSYLPYAHAIAHGFANLYEPLRRPGRNSIVGDDYWDNKREYTRIEQGNIDPENVQLSTRRVCKKCSEGGLVQYCPGCKSFFHFDRNCHDFKGCQPTTVRNPYV